MMNPGINLVMTVIGFAVSTMFIVFVCTRLICARIQLTASRRAFPTASRSELGLLERGCHGLEPVVISAFPTRKFSDGYFSSGEDAQCTVCLVDYQEKDILRILPYCGHAFHVTCIDIWLHQHSTCPVCRVSLLDSAEGKRVMQPMFSMAFRSTDCLHHCSYNTNYGYSPGTVGNHRMEPIQDDQFVAEPDLAESGAIVSRAQESKNKNLESPSNA